MNSRVFFRTAIISVGLAVVLNLILPTLIKGSAIAITPSSQAFTELYFKDIRTLPTAALPGMPASLRFVIANHEGYQVKYRYTVSITENSLLRSRKTNTVTLLNNQPITIPVNFTPSSRAKTTDITVELPDQHQTIHLRSTQ